MAEVSLASTLEKQVWISDYIEEYIRDSGYMPYMGKAATNIIQTKSELQEEAGKTINIPLITRIQGDGRTGSQVLEGFEVEQSNYNCALSVDWLRQAVRIPKSTSYKTEIDLLNAARDGLKNWSSENLRDNITKALLSIVPLTTTVTPVEYGTITALSGGGYEITAANYVASEANKDAWLVLNSDRILFGSARSNASSNDHSTALATLDATNDKLSAAVGSLAKRMAKAADPHIRPFKTGTQGREFFVMFCGSRAFRDLKADSVITAANRDARPRDVDANPIFQDGDVIYDGVIYREIPEIPVLQDVGDSATVDVQPCFLCGAQAVGIAWGQKPTPRTDMLKDFQFRPGVAIEELRRVQKLHFNGKQHGVVTVYVAAQPDT
jgi:N4-gp56 family major capsid protein